MKILNYAFMIAVLAVFLFTGTALAHKVNIFAYAEGAKIYTESYFSAGTPVDEGTVKVYDSQGNLVLKGETNKKGKFSFDIPKVDDLRIVIKASMGHKNSCTLKKSEVEAGR